MKRKKRAVTAVKIIILALLLFLALFPIYWLVSMAIRPMSEMKGHISLIPHTLTGEHFLTYRLASQAGSWAVLITFYRTRRKAALGHAFLHRTMLTLEPFAVCSEQAA